MDHPGRPQPIAFLLLGVLSGLFFLLGLGIFGNSKSAIHETEALASLFIAAILLVGAALSAAIGRLRQELWAYHVGRDAPPRPEQAYADSPISSEPAAAKESLLAPLSGLLSRAQMRTGQKSAQEQLEELRAKDKQKAATEVRGERLPK